MAFIIPTKKIYNINNPKIRDNLINSVNVEQKIITPNNEYEVTVLNQNVNSKNVRLENAEDNGGNLNFVGNSTEQWNYAFVYVYLESYFGNFNISDKRLKNNSYITKIYTGKVNDVPQIKTTYIGKKITRPITAKIDYNEMQIVGNPYDWSFGEAVESEVGYIELPPLATKYSAEHGTLTDAAYIEKEITITDTSLDFDYSNDNNIVLALTRRTDMRERKLKFEGVLSGSMAHRTLTLTGEETSYLITSIEFNIKGDIIGINLSDGAVTFFQETGNRPFTISGNELLQEGALVENTPLTQHLAENLLNQYKNGKETANILCAIETKEINLSDFSTFVVPYGTGEQGLVGVRSTKAYPFDIQFSLKVTQTSGEWREYGLVLKANSRYADLIIYYAKSSKILRAYPATTPLKKGDEIVPTILGARGKDVPMSKAENGQPKTFEVVGSRVYYDGASWQELRLIEKGYSEENVQDGTFGLIYDYYKDYYSLSGLGSISDTQIQIASVVNGLDVKVIEREVFRQYNEVTKIIVPDTVEDIGEGAFAECHSLTNIKLSNNITTIKSNTFADCVSLKSIQIPEGVKTLEDYAFSSAIALKEIYIPSTIEVYGIGRYTFYSCPLETINYNGTKQKWLEYFSYIQWHSGITVYCLDGEIFY